MAEVPAGKPATSPAPAMSPDREPGAEGAGPGPGPNPDAATAGPGLPSGPALLPPGEAAQILGGPVRETRFSPPFGAGVIYRRGGGGTVTVIVTDGLRGAASAGPARRAGRPLAGIGDEAWLLEEPDQAAVVCVAGLTAKITFVGRPGPAHARVLPGLAAAVAARLSDHVARSAPVQPPVQPPV